MSDDLPGIDSPAEGSPLHGFQGDRRRAGPPAAPAAPSVAISREVGARGNDVAHRLGARTGWTVYDSELLGYSAQDPEAYESLLAELPSVAGEWIEARMRLLHERGVLADDPTYEKVSRLILALGARGEAIFVGRGAGYILPRQTTLHARLTAPLPDRVAYLSQWLRLPGAEAAEQLGAREKKRDQFLARCFHLPSDGVLHDLMLNTSSLGEELCAELLLAALKCKRIAAADELEPSADE